MTAPDLRGKLKPVLDPESGSQLVRHIHDCIVFRLSLATTDKTDGLKAKFRTTLGQARELNEAIVEGVESGETLSANGGWVDYPMQREGAEWVFRITLQEVGFFHATAYIEDASGFQHWPSGGNIRLSVHPHHIRSGNTIYCAFTRLFGKSKHANAEAIESMSPEAKRRVTLKIIQHAIYTDIDIYISIFLLSYDL